jgi:hypothetical protein
MAARAHDAALNQLKQQSGHAALAHTYGLTTSSSKAL